MANIKATTRSKVSFLSISAFKKAIGGTFQVVHSSKTDKISVLDEFDTFYRCQQNLDVNAPMAFLLEDGFGIEDACLVNVSGTGESPLKTLATF